MTKRGKLITIIVSVAVAVALIATLIIMAVINSNREKSATTIMTCSVNPEVQFVLNGNNKVMRVNALNSDGQAIVLKVDFIGLEAEDAAEKFISISTEAGYIDIDTLGTKVSIDLSGLKDNYDKLSEKIVEKVNDYFDKNGIIAGAVATVTEDLKEAIKTLKPNAQNLENKSIEELMDQYIKISNLIEGIATENLETFYAFYNQCDKDLTNNIADINIQLEETEKLLAHAQEQIKELSSEAQQGIQELIDTYQRQIAAMKQGLIDERTNFQKRLNERLNFEKAKSENIFAELKAELIQKMDNNASKFNEHKANFEKNKGDIQKAINDYRATLNA